MLFRNIDATKASVTLTGFYGESGLPISFFDDLPFNKCKKGDSEYKLRSDFSIKTKGDWKIMAIAGSIHQPINYLSQNFSNALTL